MTGNALDKLYLCIGENYSNNMRIGFCGDTHTLKEWLTILFPEYDSDQMERYYYKNTPKHALESIYIHKGKRLMAI